MKKLVRLFKFLYDFLLNLINGHFLIVQSFRQEGLLLAYHSPRTMVINKTVQKILMAKRFTFAETGYLG
jgi:hypothetical protein